MKQKDIVLIIVVAFFSGVLAILFSTLVLGGPRNRSEQVEVVEPIVADFPLPDTDYFNATSVNPTQLIRIEDNTNTAPFGG